MWTFQQVHTDLMHTKHLGVDQYYYGSVLKFLTHHLLPASPDENMETVRAGYSGERGGRFVSFRVAMYTKAGEFPRLKGKAGEIRHFGKALPSIATWTSRISCTGKSGLYCSIPSISIIY